MALGGGLGGIILLLVLVFVFKADPTQLGELGGLTGGGGVQTRELTPAEKELGEFVSTILGFTEDVWGELYPVMAQAPRYRGAVPVYEEPTLVMFSGQVRSACGLASAAVGPFYCPGDSNVYIDLAFYEEMKRKFQAPGDFAQAYVIAHEVGHHVQNLLGITDYVHQQKARLSDAEYNRVSVRLELQADYLAGVWAHHIQRSQRVLEAGDLEEGLRAAGAIGDDRLQKRAQGYVVPDSFTHGTSEQRIRWFTAGFKSGDPTAMNPFDVPYEQL